MQIEVSPGEVVDRMTILEIKLERITDPAKRECLERDYEMLSAAWAETPISSSLKALREALKDVNMMLWQVEDDLRQHERRKDFGPGFVELARSVYRYNDRRAALKQEINALAGSTLNDIKSYAAY